MRWLCLMTFDFESSSAPQSNIIKVLSTEGDIIQSVCNVICVLPPATQIIQENIVTVAIDKQNNISSARNLSNNNKPLWILYLSERFSEYAYINWIYNNKISSAAHIHKPTQQRLAQGACPSFILVERINLHKQRNDRASRIYWINWYNRLI